MLAAERPNVVHVQHLMGVPADAGAMLRAATAGLTVLRCTSWRGGSMAMKLVAVLLGSRKPWAALGESVMPLAEENTWWLESTARMSLYLVKDMPHS